MVCIGITFLGGLSYSVGTFQNASSTSKPIVDSNTIVRKMYIRPWGIPMIIIYCTLSGFAGVYNEWILKNNYNESIHVQNIFLYSYGTIFNLIPTICLTMSRSQSINRLSFFDGFSFYTWLIVLTQVLNGLSMSIVIKYSSNIIRYLSYHFL